MDGLAARLRLGLGLSSGIGLALAAHDEDQVDLSPSGWPTLGPVSAVRRREFLSGRRCARAALAQTGGDDQASLPIGADRRPLWPDGWEGSISHAPGLAGALAARRADHAWIGFDIELLERSAYADEIAPLVVSPREAERLDGPGDVILAFSAKEALYKALRPSNFIDFDAAELVAKDAHRLIFRLGAGWGRQWPVGAILTVRWAALEGWAFTAALP
jgi:enterobactin synthetase component D